MCLVTYYVIQTVGLIILFIVNRQLTKKFTGNSVALSTRYQLAENIRTIRSQSDTERFRIGSHLSAKEF
ncbi:hypothetical protein GCK32_010584 [Trichostrongylus colubriformis]|uniref:Uncharacterized protein n=1 Tax=Trichostrongylus colubriformis TaxID=6319 RepID=A0AAN8IW00_TRICO